mgnify:CR=1 FL=1
MGGGTGYLCDVDDSECIKAGVKGASCSTRDTCADWQVDATDKQTFKQERRCYPPISVDGAKSVCCSNAGVYKLNENTGEIDENRGSCDCKNTATSGPHCEISLCPLNGDVACNGHGTCGFDEEMKVPRCFCNDGFYNVEPKDPQNIITPREDLMTCNKNLCSQALGGVTCGYDLNSWYPNLRTLFVTYPDGKKVKMPTISVPFRGNSTAAGICNEKYGLCDCADGFHCDPNPDGSTCVANNGTQFCKDATPSNCIQIYALREAKELKNRWWDRGNPGHKGDQILNNVFIKLGEFTVNRVSCNVTLNCNIKVQILSGSNSDCMIASVLVIDKTKWDSDQWAPRFSKRSDLEDNVIATESDAGRIFNLLHSNGMVPMGKFPDSTVIEESNLPRIDRDGKYHEAKLDATTRLNSGTYWVVTFLGIATDDEVFFVPLDSTVKLCDCEE